MSSLVSKDGLRNATFVHVQGANVTLLLVFMEVFLDTFASSINSAAIFPQLASDVCLGIYQKKPFLIHIYYSPLFLLMWDKTATCAGSLWLQWLTKVFIALELLSFTTWIFYVLYMIEQRNIFIEKWISCTKMFAQKCANISVYIL